MKSIFNYGWAALLIAIIGDFSISFLLSLFYKEYSNSLMSISSLGNPKSPVRVPFNIWMFVEGILFLIALPLLYNHYHNTSKVLTLLLAVFIAVFAVGSCIFTTFFSVNESKEVVTVASQIHGFGSVIGFMLFLFVPLLIAILSFKNKETMIGSISTCSFILALLFFVLFVMSDKPEFSNTIIAKEGLWQRLNLLFMYLPLGIISINSITK